MSITAISASYGTKNKSILKNVSLEIKQNEIVSLVGPNGAGKSTFLQILAGDFEPNSGFIQYDGIPLNKISIQERSFCRSVMSQSQPIIFDFTVRQVIEMGWVERGLSNYVEEFPQAVTKTAKECFVFDLLEDRFSNLSGGEQRRVHFARTLLQLWRPSGSQDPRYLILDEPTANLDLFFEREILHLLRKKTSESFGCLIVLHDLNLAAKFSDKMALLHNGVIVRFGNPKEILSSEILSEIYHLEITISENPFRINYY